MSDTVTVLLVDDEEPVRRTFSEWLSQADTGCRLLTAADASSALRLADAHTIDLAVLDWNLGAGHDGLQLLEDLALFNPDVVAILVTGHADQATPLMAMRLGVRDYLDKNHDLTRATFVGAVEKQLAHIRPARARKTLLAGLTAFREAVGRVLPLVGTVDALADPVGAPETVRLLLAFLIDASAASDGFLVVQGHAPTPVVYGADGSPATSPVPFAETLAAAVLAGGTARLVEAPERSTADGVRLLPQESGRRRLLVVPLSVGPGLAAVVELAEPTREVSLSRIAPLASELVRRSLTEGDTRRLLADALRIGTDIERSLSGTGVDAPERVNTPTPAAASSSNVLALAEAIRALECRYGESALAHCRRLIDDLHRLLDEVTGS